MLRPVGLWFLRSSLLGLGQALLGEEVLHGGETSRIFLSAGCWRIDRVLRFVFRHGSRFLLSAVLSLMGVISGLEYL